MIALISLVQWDSGWRFRPIGGAEEENSTDEVDQLFFMQWLMRIFNPVDAGDDCAFMYASRMPLFPWRA